MTIPWEASFPSALEKALVKHKPLYVDFWGVT